MTWRRAAIYWATFLALTAYYALALREPRSDVAAHLVRAPFLNLPEEQIQSLELRREETVVRCRRGEGRWRVVGFYRPGARERYRWLLSLFTLAALPSHPFASRLAPDTPAHPFGRTNSANGGYDRKALKSLKR